ncbi:MAG: restriction endonuclease subunit S [Ruminococcus sp.]|nr:restriction endonuclease subunit S [Ruminococcus sp.]
MKDSKIEWLGEIPEHWEIKKLKYIAKLSPDCDFSKISDETEIEYLPMEYIKNGYYIHNSAKYSEIPDSLVPFEAGDIVLAKVTPCFENGNIAIMNDIGVGSSELYVIRPHAINCKFIFYFFQNSRFINKAVYNMTGASGLKRVPSQFINNLPITIPPVEEQAKISAYLDKKCMDIDNLIDIKNKQINLLKEYKKALITETVTKGLDKEDNMKDSKLEWLGEVPAHWNVDKLKYHLSKRTIKNHNDSVVLSLYRELGIVPKDSRDDNNNATSEDTSDYKYVRIGDFVVNKMKAWQGSVAVSEYEGIVSPAYYVYEFTDNAFNKRYFHYLLRNKRYSLEFMRLSVGVRTGQWDLPANALENIFIIIPPIEEQEEIVKFLDEKCETIDKIIDIKNKQIDLLKEYKKTLITETVTKGLNKNISCGNTITKEVDNMIEQDTIKLLRECDAGVKMGVSAIDEVMEYVHDENLKNTLQYSKSENEKLKTDLQVALADYHDDGKDPNPIAKGMSWMKTNVKLKMNESDSNIAELISDGCHMGIKSLSRYLNQYKAADERSKTIAGRLIGTEEKLSLDMRQFL